jgi:hypothetical protein
VSISVVQLITTPFRQAQATDLLTYHNDNARTGQNLNEDILTPTSVNTSHFGKLWVLNTDGLVDAQPLYASGVTVPLKGMHNVLYVATENDSVYAFDADSTNLFWRASMLGTNEVPSDDRGCDQVTPEIGITATPVIDRQLGPNGTIFVVAMSKDASGHYFQRLHGLDLATGADRLPAATITAKYPGTGDNSDGTNVVFDPAQYKERCGLLLSGGVIYTAWASHCDNTPYTGWIIGYDEATLAQTNVLNLTPNGSEGAIWMSGAGLTADADGNIYFLDVNGTFDTALTNGFPDRGDYGNAFLKLSTTGNHLTVADYFNMANTVSESDSDTDLGSGGALVLPDMNDDQGNTRQLAVGAGKDSKLYLVDRSNLGKFNSDLDSGIYQELDGALPGGVWAMPAYFNGTLYYGSVGNYLQPFRSKTPGSPMFPRKLRSSSFTRAQPPPFPPTAILMASSGRRKTPHRHFCTPTQPPTSQRSFTTAPRPLVAVTASAQATSSSPRQSPAHAFMSVPQPALAFLACWTNPH